ncbi:MAG: ABC transporter ATP-binding protein [Cetobacterium sp.]|uniref:ABC transporter ATP-binding protein n=1 Tax=Cetobacterium sp. TaxID=2071632 RepID=UPI003F360C58
MIEIKEIKKYYKDKLILKIDNFIFKDKKIYSIMGKNGSGKSTLLSVLAQVIESDKKIIYYKQEDLILCPQEVVFLKGTLFYNLVEPFNLTGLYLDKQKLANFLVDFGLDNLKNSEIKNLSGGEKAKAQFIRTLLYNKEVVLLDEPTASMDKKSSFIVEDAILDLKKKGKIVIIVTHDYEQACRISDYIYEMDNGELVLKKEFLCREN